MKPTKLFGPNSIEDELVAGDMWRGFTLVGTDDGGGPAELPPAVKSVKLQFRDKVTRRFIWELSTETGSEDGLPTGYPANTKGNITIIDAALWSIGVDSQPLPMGPGVYAWDLEITDVLNAPVTILSGQLTICRV